jgi:hypothetical protein
MRESCSVGLGCVVSADVFCATLQQTCSFGTEAELCDSEVHQRQSASFQIVEHNGLYERRTRIVFVWSPRPPKTKQGGLAVILSKAAPVRIYSRVQEPQDGQDGQEVSCGYRNVSL